MKVLTKDSHYFWLVDLETDDVELLDTCDSFTVNNKLELGILRETDQQISPRGFDKVLTIIEEAG